MQNAGMKVTDAEFETIVKYLVKNFGPDSKK
jgi:hypothetical protein